MKYRFLLYVIISLGIISYKCQTAALDADCYYKTPYIYIRNNNSYDWTDILLKIKIYKSHHNKKTFLFNIKKFGSEKDTMINIINLANSMIDIKKDTNSHNNSIKVDLLIISYQGKLNKDFIIKE
jgi:hypothetical protein